MSRRNDFEDDGRTIADMSGIESPARLFRRRPRSSQAEKAYDAQEEGVERPWENASFTRKERLIYVGMAIGAALGIAFVLLAGLAFVIWLFTLYA